MKQIDDAIRQHYASKRMPDATVGALIGAAPNRSSRWIPAVATAAILLLAFGLYDRVQDRSDVTQGILAEVAMNHAKGLDAEIVSTSYEGLQAGLSELTFDIRPEAGVVAQFELIGGRYCSIKGQLAAQFKLRANTSGDIHTLYVTEQTEVLASIAPLDAMADETSIRLWSDTTRFFALAGPEAAHPATR